MYPEALYVLFIQVAAFITHFLWFSQYLAMGVVADKAEVCESETPRNSDQLFIIMIALK